MANRVSDIIEGIGEQALTFGGLGILSLAAGLLFRRYSGGYLDGLSWVLILAGVGGIGFAIYRSITGTRIDRELVECVYCQTKNEFTSFPDEDFRCSSCNRLVPVANGKVMPVFQVRCGYCNTLNYYSEKTEVLICEECDREIPIAREDGRPTKHLMKAYSYQEDDKLYELILTGTGTKNEELIASLQHILALNRNQVKQMLSELPVTILTGISRKKAEMIQAQLSINEGVSEFRAL